MKIKEEIKMETKNIKSNNKNVELKKNEKKSL